ncbi:MAG: tRNA pseudouridine(55) synthase TruB [Xanthomonadales bacterium]|nr:tRNA pseudouridine(55) synthase TruB [Gammaproteobacteria bacterium]MBT8054467.1 tRNA pseudouridine(55) synthase TruB [Gammaproteobacteria bacterium]NND57682.1 tRNA pseudouridine(55) synthase TruB [Xanthomonadales bacterium]NNK52647.1 tRNA pseudouridine(55) synthase TruB [Xanthomonadales bacterium]
MSRRRKGRDVHGVILLDKPAGFSSSQAVQKVRWIFGARKAGHTGSLDPFATGMLPICLGEASKTAGFMLDSSKTYLATALLGQSTSTGDIEGEVLQEMDVPALDAPKIDEILNSFLGTLEQVPPMYSALKHEGQRLYKLARAGVEVDRKARSVEIYGLESVSWEPPLLQFRVRCSKGTYVRTLAEDIAAKLGTCAHLSALRRLEVEPFHEQDMISLDELAQLAEAGQTDSCLLPVDAGLADWPLVTLDQTLAHRFTHGNPVTASGCEPGPVRVYGPKNDLLGLGEITPENHLKPKRVMNLQ